MKNIPPVVSTLDNLLHQTLPALARGTVREDEIRVRFDTAFDHIVRFYRAAETIACQCVVEPDGAVVEIDHRHIRCPRLLGQCLQTDSPVSRALTFAYVPDRADRIALDILHANANYRASQFFEWTARNGWCSAGGKELDGESHAATIRCAFYESDLFTPTSMELVPFAASAGAR
ncbi:hypothetical protein [Rudaea sp.]|uniref:hypothetical protein n=1 Tax=Rudaea sp. TaxID=2136325 RepID=UPI00378316A0